LLDKVVQLYARPACWHACHSGSCLPLSDRRGETTSRFELPLGRFRAAKNGKFPTGLMNMDMTRAGAFIDRLPALRLIFDSFDPSAGRRSLI
jgi:hypothetical protein